MKSKLSPFQFINSFLCFKEHSRDHNYLAGIGGPAIQLEASGRIEIRKYNAPYNVRFLKSQLNSPLLQSEKRNMYQMMFLLFLVRRYHRCECHTWSNSKHCQPRDDSREFRWFSQTAGGKGKNRRVLTSSASIQRSF